MSAARRRILYLQPNNDIGGSDLALLRMIEGLDAARYSCLVALPYEGPLTSRLNDVGAETRIVPMARLRTIPSVSYQARYLGGFVPSVRRLGRLIRDERIDIVHTNSLYSLYGGWAARVARVPHVWHVREIPPALPVARTGLGRMVLGLSRRVIAMTNACAVGLFGAGQDSRVRIFADGIDFDRWAPMSGPNRIRAELGIAADTPVVGFVARLDPWKGLSVFLDAAAILARRHPDAVFLVSGDAPAGFEAHRDEMQAKAVQLGLADRVHFLGWRYRLDDIPELMSALTVFSHTSIDPEPFGLVLTEAMAMGRPVVASRAGGPLEIVVDGESGLLTEPGDAGAHAAAVSALLSDPARREAIATAGRRRVEECFSRQRFQAALHDLYEEIGTERP